MAWSFDFYESVFETKSVHRSICIGILDYRTLAVPKEHANSYQQIA